MTPTEQARYIAQQALNTMNADWNGDRAHGGNYWTGYLASALEDIVRELDAARAAVAA